MAESSWALILHGGARTIAPEDEAANRRGCLAAASAGQAVLGAGGCAIDAVEAAVRALEADATFNAGYGAVLNAEGVPQRDAAVMTGGDLAIGAVAALEDFPHAISIARRLLAEPEILLVGQGAHQFAKRHAEPEVRGRGAPARVSGSGDTVGCIALDQAGRMAVGLSTGGLSGKPAGRVGDTPLPGCGFYVDDLIGGVALSGDGESIARLMLAARIMDGLGSNLPQAAASAGLSQLRRVGGEAGAIVLDRAGRMGCSHTSSHFAVALASNTAPPRAALHHSELKDLLHG